MDYCIVCGHGGNDVLMANEQELPGSTSFPMCAACRLKAVVDQTFDKECRGSDSREPRGIVASIPLMDEELTADDNWCPDCGEPREACHGQHGNYLSEPDDDE